MTSSISPDAASAPQDDDRAPSNNKHAGSRKLSTVSRMYDIRGDGELDEAELAMRHMDTSGRGYLTNDKVYELMQDHVHTQRKLFQFKKIIIGLAVLVVILALSNLGTSFAAAILSRDTVTKTEETIEGEEFGADLIDKKSKETVGTQTANDSIEVDRASSLCVEGDTELNCATDSYLSVPENVIKSMFYKCLTGRTVNVERTFSNGHVKSFNICSSSTNVEFNEFDRSTLENNGETIHFDPMDGDYKVSGNGLLQKEQEVCDVDEDCLVNLTCYKNLTAIEGCQDICRRKRWAPHRVEACVLSCDHSSCLQEAVDE
mmetsp:Transcript_25041/g.35796  ORF Transcript_25041/g.35796 Transcript_25041/m.35796 type:complete len:317 (-) Transcript_25041:32-982(-)|eukprot:CAMPEP_0201697274 /NCGR_PEP_ID=MMETSP0578-20130828/10344_1 /ASSEMBLY_ACC=CAM_ASM_000663 /TAXON_ID=267565 /ORGANISM="Skeletonema grethea, Strain CCMP 1804" /LENGTH=316 /DNA_ID=CAMNT_0048183401 /DNA_START=77 /DNA_END=1027 /DNA_ORIENTATION=+